MREPFGLEPSPVYPVVNELSFPLAVWQALGRHGPQLQQLFGVEALKDAKCTTRQLLETACDRAACGQPKALPVAIEPREIIVEALCLDVAHWHAQARQRVGYDGDFALAHMMAYTALASPAMEPASSLVLEAPLATSTPIKLAAAQVVEAPTRALTMRERGLLVTRHALWLLIQWTHAGVARS